MRRHSLLYRFELGTRSEATGVAPQHIDADVADNAGHPVNWPALSGLILPGLSPNPQIRFLQSLARGIGICQYPARDRIELTAGKAVEFGKSDLIPRCRRLEQLREEVGGLLFRHISVHDRHRCRL